uniref:NR LBD domain-containing protein n=1 Tax=Caenorhabditis japonica TaxID=281687 RepID=A0A8R1HNV1_CAEJA
MRREAVTSSILPSESRREAPDVYVEYLSQPSTSTDLARVTETAATLRQTLRLINKFRRSNVHLQDIDLHISTLLSMPSFLEIQGSYEEVRDFSQFKRDLPAWLTVDLLCAIEFVKKIPDLAKFKDSDKEELIRSTCFTLAIAIQAIESYFDQHTRVVMPDGTDVIQAIISTGGVIHSDYNQMFVTVLDPLHREKFTIDELVLALQLLFFTIEQKMKEAEPFRQKLQDLLIEQCVYDYRPF